MSVSGTGLTADRNDPLSVVSYVTMSSGLNLNFLKIYSPSKISIKQMGSVPKNLVPSQHSCQLNTYKTEQPFLPGL